MLPLLLAGLALVSPPQEERSHRERIDDLIASTNELDSFRARYELEKDGAVDAEFVLAYAAPGRGLLAVERGDGDVTARADTWVVDGVVSVRVDNGKGGGGSGDVDLTEPAELIAAASAVLTELFPPAEAGIGPGPIFIMSWGINAETDKADFDLKLAFEREDRSALLGWLPRLRAVADEVTLEDGRFIFSSDQRIHVEVNAESGFVERVDLVGLDGKTASVRLRELELGAVPSDESFAPDPLGADEPNVFAEDAERMRGHPRDFRQVIFGRVTGQLASGQRAWDDDTRADWRALVEALHGPFVESSFAPWRERSQERAEGFAERLAQEVAGATGPEALSELRAVAASWRTSLEENLGASFASFAGTLSLPDSLSARLEDYPELAEVEAEVLREAFDESVAATLLESFDELVAEAFDD